MKKLLLIIILTLSIQYLFSQTIYKYAVFNDSLLASKRLTEMNQMVRFQCRIKKDKITSAYSKLVSNKTHSEWAIEILDRYEYLFTKPELDNAIELDSTWQIKQ